MKSGKRIEKSRERPRRYDDACAAAHALDLVGDRWALLVMRELLLGPRRFTDLRGSLPGLSANVLTQRLEELEASGVVLRRRLPPPAGSQVYALTDWGLESEPILQALGRWAARSPRHDPGLPISAVSFLLSLRTMLDPARAAGMDASIGFRLLRGPPQGRTEGGAQGGDPRATLAAGAHRAGDGPPEAGPAEESFLGRLAGGRLRIAAGAVEDADLILSGPPAALAAAIFGGVPLEALETGGALRVEGDRALAARFVTLFPLPAKAPPAG